MNQIKISITNFDLDFLAQIFEQISSRPNLTRRDEKVAFSVLQKVSASIRKKSINQQKDLFAAKKKVTLSFEFYEAHYLEHFLTIAIATDSNPVFNSLRVIRDSLNQKLA